MYTDEQAMTAIVDEFQFIPAYTNFSSDAINDPLSKEIYTYLSEGKTVPWVHNSYPDGFGKMYWRLQICERYAFDRISSGGIYGYLADQLGTRKEVSGDLLVLSSEIQRVSC